MNTLGKIRGKFEINLQEHGEKLENSYADILRKLFIKNLMKL